jgi:hypothetical protein
MVRGAHPAALAGFPVSRLGHLTAGRKPAKRIYNLKHSHKTCGPHISDPRQILSRMEYRGAMENHVKRNKRFPDTRRVIPFSAQKKFQDSTFESVFTAC